MANPQVAHHMEKQAREGCPFMWPEEPAHRQPFQDTFSVAKQIAFSMLSCFSL